MTEEARAAPSLPTDFVPRLVATLDPGYFAWVMATGIVSIGTSLLGYPILSRVILGVAIFAFVVLVAAYTARLIWFSGQVRASLRDPTTAMAYFTVTAGTDVLATRLIMAGHPNVAIGLGIPSALIWLALTYGLPWSIIAISRRPAPSDVNGTWLIWVVATQSLAIVAALLTPHLSSASWQADLPVVAICLWGVGVMLYLILIVMIFLRLVLIEMTPAEMGPAYWITMGATAISALAAARILLIHGSPADQLIAELRPFLLGSSVVLWAFGTWLIPLLVLLGIWRYLIRGYPRTYEPRLWSVVFPLGMYTAASWTLGQAGHFTFMESVARVWLWVGVGAWFVVLVMMGASLFSAARERPSPAQVTDPVGR